MRVCLINPLALQKPGPTVLHGLLQIHAELTRAGHEVDIVDFNVPGTPLSYERFNTYDVVGLSVMTTQLRHATEIADALADGVRVVWGGVHCLLDPLCILKRYPDHFVISGDGEGPLLSLLDYLDDKHSRDWLRAQKGICFCDGEPVVNPPFFHPDLENLADIDYYSLPHLEQYLQKSIYYFRDTFPTLSILTSRGCHWNCSFCINAIYRKHGGCYRGKSIDKVRRETERVIDDFGVRVLLPQDEDFFWGWDFVEGWQKYVSEKGCVWAANCRYNYFTDRGISEGRLRQLVDHGLFAIGMSIEAGDEEVRNKVLRKGVKDKHIYQAVERIKNSVGDRLCVNTSFIAFFPGDSHSSRVRTVRWMDYLSRNINVTFSGPQLYRPYPGSQLYEMQTTRVHGELDYYLDEIDLTGTETGLGQRHEAVFYSELLTRFMNSRFRFLQVTFDGDGRPRVRVEGRAKGAGLSFLVFRILTLPIAVRAWLNLWSFFIDPRVLGLLHEKIEKLRQSVSSLRPKAAAKP